MYLSTYWEFIEIDIVKGITDTDFDHNKDLKYVEVQHVYK